MRIGIITLHRAENYGSVLQTYALQKKLEDMGCDAVTLDYHPERYTNKGKLRRLKDKSTRFNNPLFLLAAQVLIYPSYMRKNRVFENFISKYLKLSDLSFSNNEEAKTLDFGMDAYCTGSDQVWNSHWNEGVEKALFLDFAPKGKMLFSYAASIGLDFLPKEEVEQTRSLLARYEYISLREDTGVEIVKRLGRNDAMQVLDPTLLLNKDEWDKALGIGKDTPKNRHYVVTYNLHHDKTIDDYAVALAKKYGLKVYNISYNWHDVVRKGHLAWCPSVEDFVSLIKHADYVIADSFHATAFSIIYEKKFVSIIPEIASARLSSLLKITGLENRLMNSGGNDLSVIERDINYGFVNERINIEKEKSIDFLQRVISTKIFTHNK